VCGKHFVARGSSSNRLTCSDACSLENSREKSRRHARANYQPRENTRPERTCEECGVTFQPVRDNQKWCSGLCRRKGVDKAKPHRVAVRVCVKCGAEVERKPGKPVCDACKVDKRASAQARERRRTLRVYGLTEADFDAMLAAQHGRCAICRGEDPGTRGWAVDHDHGTGAVRGLLCTPCNTALGFFQDSPELLDAARRYLLSHRSRNA
jgi:hypothetical protein